MFEYLFRISERSLGQVVHWSTFTAPKAAEVTYQQRLADGPFSVSIGASGGAESFTFPSAAWPIEYADCTKPKGQIRP